MSTFEEKFRKALKRIHKLNDEDSSGLIYFGIVSAVDGFKTCDVKPLNGSPELFDIRLKPNITNNKEGLILVPKVGSLVVVARAEKESEWSLLMASEIDSCFLQCENVEMNGGGFGGLIKVEALVIDLNSIKAQINQLRTILTAWVPVPGDGGTALKTALASFLSGQLPNTQRNTIENEKIKHG